MKAGVRAQEVRRANQKGLRHSHNDKKLSVSVKHIVEETNTLAQETWSLITFLKADHFIAPAMEIVNCAFFCHFIFVLGVIQLRPSLSCGSSFPAIGPANMSRNSPEFEKLEPRYNNDTIFRDDEGTSTDRLMSKVGMLSLFDTFKLRLLIASPIVFVACHFA